MSQPEAAPRPVMLCILDGWGLSPCQDANAVALGRTPNFDRLWNTCPHTQLIACEGDVGLPQGVFGNSEVGHLNIGAGRIVWQDSLLIDQSINEGSFFDNDPLRAVMHHARENGKRLHLMGLVSDGTVHSSESHYFALLEMAAREGLRADQVVFHVFTDGRDTPPRSAQKYVSRLLERMVTTGVGCVASVVGRYYAMDRDNRWERVSQAYELLTQGRGHTARDAMEALEGAYSRDENDEFITPTVVCGPDGQPRPRIEDNDAVLFFNYRSDRGRQLTQAFIDPDFDAHLREESQQPGAPEAQNTPVVQKFRRSVWPQTHFVTMTRYASTLTCPIAFEPRPQRMGLGETASLAGKTQLRIAETEKYPHVTYFFSGGMEEPWPGEERVLVPSPKVATYDLQPEMNAPEVTRRVTEAIRSEQFDLIILNYANPDMVGHTGILEAAIRAVEEVDKGLGQIIESIEATKGTLLVIADHGNCEQMIDYETGQPHTAHTLNPVPCILYGQGSDGAKLRNGGRLADVAPTLLRLMNVEQPPEMTGIDLLQTSPNQLTDAHLGSADELAKAAKAVSHAIRFFDLAPRISGNGAHQEYAAKAQSLSALQAQLPAVIESSRGIEPNTALQENEIAAAGQEAARALSQQLEAVASTAPEELRSMLNGAAQSL